MSSNIFNGQILSEKLTKLNNSQQSIESLSRWCISHRKKARQIVETWNKLFHSSQKEQCVSFLYLANDILQNSRRKGSEFVNEFWKVLPSALKHVYENGDDHGKKAVARLVDIWDERKVFGSRGQSLKDEMLGKDPPPLSVSNGKGPNPIKIVKRDAHSVRIKLAVGGLPEKILTAFQTVHEEHGNEEAVLNKCEAAIICVGKLEKDVENSIAQGNERAPALIGELADQENALEQCVGKLESVEATRAALVSELRDALNDQEPKLETVRTQLQIVRRLIEQVNGVRQRLISSSSSAPAPLTTVTTSSTEFPIVVESNLPYSQSTPTPSELLLTQPVISFATSQSSEENKKAAAAAVAAKLAASTSSAQMLTSVLSSLVAEEAASVNGGIMSAGFASSLPLFSQGKRPKLETPMQGPDVSTNSDALNTDYISPIQQQQTMGTVPYAPSPSIRQTPFPPPPPPSLPPNQPTNQYAQSTGMMVGVTPYGFGSGSLPLPPPMPSHISMGLARPGLQPPQQPQSQPLPQPQQGQQQQQQPVNGGFYRPPGIGFYGQSHPPSTPPVPRQ